MKTKILKHRVPQRILIGMLLVLFCFTSKAQTWENVHFNVGTFIKYYKISQLIHTQSIAN